MHHTSIWFVTNPSLVDERAGGWLMSGK